MNLPVQKHIPEIVACTSGAIVMAVELVASRILAPAIGTSLVAWTSVIGIIMASLSLGYWYGGILADKKASHSLSFVLLGASVSLVFVLLTKDTMLSFSITYIGDIYIRSIIATAIVFGPISLILGMILPMITKLRIVQLQHSGQAVGTIYALSTIGSIVGTFVTGFWLIGSIGSASILTLMAFLLLLLAAVSYFFLENGKKYILLLTFIVFLVGRNEQPHASFVLDTDTAYSRVWIEDTTDPSTNRPVRHLYTDPRGRQSSMFLDRDDNLVAPYKKFFRLIFFFHPTLTKTLMIGGGTYEYPKDYLRQSGTATIDVVEIDPMLTQIAKHYFQLPTDPRLTIIHEDARPFLSKRASQHSEIYDAIILDAFERKFAVPFPLVTREAIQLMNTLLSPNGVIAMNVVSSVTGDSGKLLRALIATYRSVFPQVFIFPVLDPSRPSNPQNIILIALKSRRTPLWHTANPMYEPYLSHKWNGEIHPDIPILTDDFAPVEQYIAGIL